MTNLLKRISHHAPGPTISITSILSSLLVSVFVWNYSQDEFAKLWVLLGWFLLSVSVMMACFWIDWRR